MFYCSFTWCIHRVKRNTTAGCWVKSLDLDRLILTSSFFHTRFKTTHKKNIFSCLHVSQKHLLMNMSSVSKDWVINKVTSLLVCFCFPTESKEVYKRHVLSITSIAMAISLLGTLCMALYCRNK